MSTIQPKPIIAPKATARTSQLPSTRVKPLSPFSPLPMVHDRLPFPRPRGRSSDLARPARDHEVMTKATDSRQSSVGLRPEVDARLHRVLVDRGELLVGERRAGERVEVRVQLLAPTRRR